MGKFIVNIAGKDYHIVSDESGEYVNQLAYFLNEQISATSKNYIGVGLTSVLTLIALILADELHKSIAALERLQEQMEQIQETLRKTEIELSMKTAAKPNSIEPEIRRLQELCQKLEEENRQLKQRQPRRAGH